MLVIVERRQESKRLEWLNDEILGFNLVFVGHINTDFNFSVRFYWLFLKSQFWEGN